MHSHALLSTMLVEGRQDVPKDHKRAFELASAGAGMGCAHSKGALGRCFGGGLGVAKDHAKVYALGRDSATVGSCIGQHVVGEAFSNGEGVAQDQAEAVRWYRLAAAQGHAVEATWRLKRTYMPACPRPPSLPFPPIVHHHSFC
jgi:TPR repeat protein